MTTTPRSEGDIHGTLYCVLDTNEYYEYSLLWPAALVCVYSATCAELCNQQLHANNEDGIPFERVFQMYQLISGQTTQFQLPWSN